MFVALLLFTGGLFLLVRGANVFVSSAAAFANEFGISRLIIGLSVVAFGTSIPELAINIFSTIDGSLIGISNAIGASIANVAFILGISAVMLPIHVNIRAFRRQVPLAVFSVILLMMLVMGDFSAGSFAGVIGRSEGAILLMLFGLFVYHLFFQALHEHKVFEEHKIVALKETTHAIVERALIEPARGERPKRHYLFVGLIGLGALLVGAHVTVMAGQSLAAFFNIQETFIGLVIVSLGTTLPELATAFAAIKQNQPDIVIGNAIGSTIFNILAIVGITAIIEPIGFPGPLFFDALVLLGFLVHFFTIGATGRKISRKEGTGLLFFYILYIIVISVR